MTRAVLVIASVALVLLPHGRAAAWTCIQSSCPVWCEPARYALSIASEDLGDATTVAEVQRAMGDWAAQSCTSLETAYTGRTSATAGDGDGESVIGWVESGWTEGSGVLGIAGPRWGRDGCITEADMQLNGQDWTWITGSGTRGNINTYSIVLHEGGHYVGLGHSTDSDAVMFASYGGGISLVEADDRLGICTLYPGEPMPDCAVTGCPTGEVCENGTCVPEPGCTDPSDCAPNEVCNTTTGECEPMPPGNEPLGSPCATGAECASALCVATPNGMVCSTTCNPLSTSACPTGFYCNESAAASCNTGLCYAGTAGTGQLGQTCDGDTDCASLLCDGGFCALRCTSSGSPACPSGYACQTAGATCGACRVAGGFGTSCDVDDDCTSNLCFEPTEGTPFCSTGCADDDDCPTDFVCAVFGAARICDRAPPPIPPDGGTTTDEVRVLEGHCTCNVPGAPRNGGLPPIAALAGLAFAAVVIRRRRRAATFGSR